jgi:hypothetical protein
MLKLRLVATITLAFLIGALAGKAQRGAIPEGTKPFVPSRLEWLALDMESRFRSEFSSRDGFSIDFVAIGADNTLLVYVRYLPRAEREIMNMRIETIKKVIAIESKQRGWSSWLRVKEDVMMEDPSAK